MSYFSPTNPTVPAFSDYVITPSDTTDLPTPTRAIYVGVSGNITLTLVGKPTGTAGTLYQNVPVGLLRVQAARVWATGTDVATRAALVAQL